MGDTRRPGNKSDSAPIALKNIIILFYGCVAPHLSYVPIAFYPTFLAFDLTSLGLALMITGLFIALFALFALIPLGAIWVRKIPVISIPTGILFMAPFVWGMVEDFFRSRDSSVGAAFVPFVLFVFFILALIGAFIFFCGMRQLEPKLRAVFMLGLPIFITTIVGIAFLWWSQANVDHVIVSAEKIAGNEPYCIDVASENGHKEATSMSDFTGYHMRASHGWGWYAGRHAILAVGNGVQPEIYHWSYNKKSFIKDNGDGKTRVYCSPRLHFATTIPNEQSAEPQFNGFRYAGMYFSIPLTYRGAVNGFSSYPTVTFYAMAPGFDSVPDNASGIDAINSHIEVNFADTNRTDAWLTKGDPAHILEESGEEYGLKKHTLWYVGSGQREKTRQPYFQYFYVSDDKRVVTVIDCPDKIKGQCLHAFKNDGWTYTFHHSPVDLANWKSMQERLVKLTHSFIVKQ